MPRFVFLALLLALAPPAVAGETESATGRYAFVAVAAGALRLDTETGEVSLCVVGDGATICTRVSENIRLTIGERAKLEAKIAELGAHVSALDARVDALEAREREAVDSADEAAMNRVKTLAAQMMRHFVGAVRAVKDDIEGNEL
jgi:BMFP domain-containing protein YqiC